MLDDHGRWPPDNRRRHLVVLRGPGLAPDYRYRAVDGRRGIAAVEALGNPSGTVARVPDSGMGQLHPGTLARATRPPISRTRLGMAPDDEMVIVPIKIMVEPQAQIGRASCRERV